MVRDGLNTQFLHEQLSHVDDIGFGRRREDEKVIGHGRIEFEVGELDRLERVGAAFIELFQARQETGLLANIEFLRAGSIFLGAEFGVGFADAQQHVERLRLGAQWRATV